MYLTGYRIAMIVAGAGSLWIASFLGTEIYNQKVWQQVYQIMALLMLFGVLTVFYSSEPKIKRNIEKKSNQKIKFFITFLASLAGFILCYLYFKDLFDKYGRILVLSVSVKNGGKSEDFCFIRTDQIKLDELSSDGTYISELFNGIECEDKGLYLDALSYYKKSMELWGLGDDVSTEASASYWILWHKLFK
jgi:hypothetical protein